MDRRGQGDSGHVESGDARVIRTGRPAAPLVRPDSGHAREDSAFLFTVAPLQIEGGTGSAVSPVAVI
jgi:hypothetical protein